MPGWQARAGGAVPAGQSAYQAGRWLGVTLKPKARSLQDPIQRDQTGAGAPWRGWGHLALQLPGAMHLEAPDPFGVFTPPWKPSHRRSEVKKASSERRFLTSVLGYTLHAWTQKLVGLKQMPTKWILRTFIKGQDTVCGHVASQRTLRVERLRQIH